METCASQVIAVLAALSWAQVDAAITGGWGIDALLGRQTRPHADVDIGVASGDVDKAVAALGNLGYAVEVDQRPARIVLASERGSVDIHPIVWSAAGEGVQQAFDDVVIAYPPGSLDASGTIDGVEVRCATPELQLAFHDAAAPRDVDRHDMAALAAEFDLELPEGYRLR